MSGGGFDVVVEATGSAAVGEVCVPLTRNGGTVMLYGVTEPEDRIAISPFDVFRREITIKGSFAGYCRHAVVGPPRWKGASGGYVVGRSPSVASTR